MMHIDRIVYRLGSEIPFEWIKNRIDEVLSQYQTENFLEDINNILELQNILQYIDYFTKTGESIPTEYTSHRSEINRILGVYFSEITNDNLTELATDLYFDYRLSFWENICRYKRIDVIEDESFAKCLEKNSYQISAILSRKEIVSKFSKVIYQHLLVNARNIDVVISYLLEKEDNSSKKLYILDFFADNELNNLFKVYIQSENPNPNTLTLIRISQNDLKIGLTDEIR